jgi:hypothetical protein
MPLRNVAEKAQKILPGIEQDDIGKLTYDFFVGCQTFHCQ